ncbi:MAG: hypothetical protein K6E13_08090 [Lachnospiraceae bacterium]|nr:hypothetical protein [Lachnospiraceae bacterium]
MNISMFTKTSYSPYFGEKTQNSYVGITSSDRKKKDEDGRKKTRTEIKNEQFREMLRNLKKTENTNKNPFAVGSNQNDENGFLKMTGAPEKNDEYELQKSSKYNYKEVANKILRAKNSLSAGQAVLSAKRKVQEVRRKISSGDGDAEELQIALTHAKRMEMVAKKKKRHLELEELVENTQKRDEKLDRQEEAVSDLKNAVIDAKEEEITELEDKIFDERQQMIEEFTEDFEETGEEVTEEMLTKLNEMVSEFGEEELKQLEEAMEMLDLMEIVDPHMSKEELEELKRKHRASEYKAIVKADMDYLKDMIELQTEKASESVGGSFPGASAGFDVVSSGVEVSAPAGEGSLSIDVQL